MATISLGGVPLNTPAPKPALPRQAVSVIAANLWDNYIEMQAARALSVGLWARIQALEAKIAQHPASPAVAQAEVRIDDLRRQLRQAQYLFLIHEADANDRWQALDVGQREEQQADVMFGVPSDAGAILGQWGRKLGGNPAPPPDLGFEPVLYKFIDPEHVRAYADGYAWYQPGSTRVPEVRRG